MSEQAVVDGYFPPSEVPAEPGAAVEQATGPGGDSPPVPGADAPQEPWAPDREQWEAVTSQLQAVTQAAEQQRLAAQARAWADRVGPEAVDAWVQEQHWAAADREQEQAFVDQQLDEANVYALDYIASVAQREGFDNVDVDAVAELANEVLPDVVAELGAGPEAAHVAMQAATEAVLQASPEGQARLNTSFLVDRFARDGFGRPTGADVDKVIADAGGAVNDGLVGKFGAEVAVAEALYRAAGGQEHNVAQKWTTIHAALREMNNGRKPLAPSVNIDWGRRP